MPHIPTVLELNDAELELALRRRIDNKTKPPGALGRLEGLALRLGLILGSETPRLEHPQLVVFAADHGLAARGVSARAAARGSFDHDTAAPAQLRTDRSPRAMPLLRPGKRKATLVTQ